MCVDGSAAFHRQSAFSTGYGEPKIASLDTVGPKSSTQVVPELEPHSGAPALVSVATTAARITASSPEMSSAPENVATWLNSSGWSWA
jgi:hypothetical protein